MAISLSLRSTSPLALTLTVTRRPAARCSLTAAASPKSRLLSLIADQDRGLKTQRDPVALSSIIAAIDDMAALGRDMVTTDGSLLSATWRLLWTTEKEQLFIIENARRFGTAAGDVLQVIDVDRGVLNNVITFPPDGVFFVRSTIEIASKQRVNFRFLYFCFGSFFFFLWRISHFIPC